MVALRVRVFSFIFSFIILKLESRGLNVVSCASLMEMVRII